MEKENKSLIAKFIKKIVLKPILISIAAVVIAGVGTTGVFLLNRRSEVVVTKFRYNFKGVSDKLYPDGSIVGPSDILNKQIVETIKSENDEFSYLDIEQLFFPDSGLSIQEISEDNVETYYEIIVPTRYFKSNQKQAITFLELVNEHYADFVFSKYNNLLIKDAMLFGADSAEEAFENSNYFEILFNIGQQNDNINNFLRSVSEDNTGTATGSRSYELELAKYSKWYNEEVQLLSLENEVVNNLYVRNFATTTKIAQTNKTMLEKEINYIQELIDALTNKFLEIADGKTNVDTNVMMSLLASHIGYKADLERKLKIYENFDDVTTNNINAAFDLELKTIYSKMVEFTETINAKFLQYESQNIKRITVASAPYVFVKPYRPIIAAPLLLVGGFALFGMLLVLIDELKVIRKEALMK